MAAGCQKCFCVTLSKSNRTRLRAQERFNARQKRADRRIPNYYEKICTGHQEKPFHEIIIQIGNKDDMSALGENAELAKTVLNEYYQDF